MGDASDGVGVEGILKVVKSLRQEGMAASFCFGTDLAPLSGKQCWVYAIGFPDQTTWAIRVPVHIKNLPPDIISNTVEEEASVLKRLERCDFSWSPRLIGYCSGFDNPIAYPYIVSTWIHGSPLQWTDDIPCSRESRDSLLRQMGEILMQLAERTQCQGIGGDAVTFLTDIIDRKLSRALRGGLPDISPQSCLLQRALVRNTFASTADPMVLSHEDLDPSNIIVDEQCNIQGIIDWGFARALPCQYAVRLPRFLSIEACYPDDRLPIDIAGFSSRFLEPSTTLRLDRQVFTSHITSTLSKADQENAHSVRSLTLSILCDSNVDWRQFLFESVSSKGMHRWMDDRQWLLPGLTNPPVDLDSVPLSICDELEIFLGKMKEKGVEFNDETLNHIRGMTQGALPKK